MLSQGHSLSCEADRAHRPAAAPPQCVNWLMIGETSRRCGLGAAEDGRGLTERSGACCNAAAAVRKLRLAPHDAAIARGDQGAEA